MPSVLVENVGTPRHEAQLIAGFVELMFIVGNTLPALALDRMGRRKTMMIGAGCLSFCMMMITILLSFGQPNTSAAAIAFFFLVGGSRQPCRSISLTGYSICLFLERP